MHMFLLKQSFSQLMEAWGELSKGLKHGLDTVCIGDLVLWFFDRCVEIKAAQFLAAKQLGLQSEVAPEDSLVLLSDSHQGLDDSVNDIDDAVAYRDGRLIFTQ